MAGQTKRKNRRVIFIVDARCSNILGKKFDKNYNTYNINCCDLGKRNW